MKQRGKRSNSKLVHVSFDEVERFVPRVPKQICPDEDNTTPRICVAPNVLSAIQAMPQGGTVAYNMARIGVPVVIHAYYIESDAILMPEQIADKVPDAVSTGEMWVMAVPAAVRRIDYEIVDPYVPMRIDRNGTRERFLVWYGEKNRPTNVYCEYENLKRCEDDVMSAGFIFKFPRTPEDDACIVTTYMR